MNYTRFEEAMEQAGLPKEVEAFSVYRAFEQIPDGRHKRGVRYSSALSCAPRIVGARLVVQ